jgi:hypothetical protein
MSCSHIVIQKQRVAQCGPECECERQIEHSICLLTDNLRLGLLLAEMSSSKESSLKEAVGDTSDETESNRRSTPPLSSNPAKVCSPSLLKHLQKIVLNVPWTTEESKQVNSVQLLDDLFTLAKQKDSVSEKALRKWLSESSEKISKTLRMNSSLLAAYEQRKIDAKRLVEIHDDLRVQNKRIFEEITMHHETLVADGYDNAVSVESSLKKYKNAASEMGKVSHHLLSTT